MMRTINWLGILPAMLAGIAFAACNNDVSGPVDVPSNDGLEVSGPQRITYYLAADRVAWDYAPEGFNLITGEPFDEEANVFVQSGDDRIGSTYYKALYREYTDASFTTLKPVAPEWQHLGTLGPVIRAAVGDTIELYFKNKLPYPSVSVHPHGVFYDKNSEGAPYNDGTGLKDDDFVDPGETHRYVWPVPERAGPGPADPSSIMWMYHSHVNEPKDTNTGLIGPIIITARGRGGRDRVPNDVDREFVMMFTVFDENDSWYIEDNINAFAGDPGSVDPDDEEFEESNLMHSINGWVFGNQPLGSVTMSRGERVRWYMLGVGNEVDLHTPHWHGQTGLWMGARTDIIELLPASMKVFDMVPDNPGIWLLHCHVNDHITAGMLTRFDVMPF
jgi:hephaestin